MRDKNYIPPERNVQLYHAWALANNLSHAELKKTLKPYEGKLKQHALDPRIIITEDEDAVKLMKSKVALKACLLERTGIEDVLQQARGLKQDHIKAISSYMRPKIKNGKINIFEPYGQGIPASIPDFLKQDLIKMVTIFKKATGRMPEGISKRLGGTENPHIDPSKSRYSSIRMTFDYTGQGTKIFPNNNLDIEEYMGQTYAPIFRGSGIEVPPECRLLHSSTNQERLCFVFFGYKQPSRATLDIIDSMQ